MYPGPTKSPQNHKRGYCSDGCPVSFDRFAKVKKEPATQAQSTTATKDSPPQYPQPDGIFSNGDSFNCIQFLQHVKDIYERAVMREQNQAVSDFTIEDQAFALMLESRTLQLHNETVGFRLYEGLHIDETTASKLVVELDGTRYLRMQMLEQPGGLGVSDSGTAPTTGSTQS